MHLHCNKHIQSQWNMHRVSACLWWLACRVQIESFQSAPVITATNTSAACSDTMVLRARICVGLSCVLACKSHALSMREGAINVLEQSVIILDIFIVHRIAPGVGGTAHCVCTLSLWFGVIELRLFCHLYNEHPTFRVLPFVLGAGAALVCDCWESRAHTFASALCVTGIIMTKGFGVVQSKNGRRPV